MSLTHKPRRVLRLKEVCRTTGLSKSTIYNKCNRASKYFDASFPFPFKISLRLIGWDAEQIEAWVQSKMDESHATTH